jgi:integrase
MLTARGVHAAGDGDHGDGGGLVLRVRDGAAAWVFRFTAPTGRRREMGLGVAHRGSVAQAGEALTAARDQAHVARDLLRRGVDPIEDRDQRRQAAQQAEEARKAQRQQDRWTLARCARDYHERVVEPARTTKHGAQWIASLENHVPAALWHRPIGEVTAPELLAALLAVKPHDQARNVKGPTVPETVRRIRQRLDAVFEDAIFHGRATANPAAAIRRKMREAAPKQTKGSLAALPYRAAPELVQRLRTTPGTAARCLHFAVLTAARTSEALLAEWSEFDLHAGTWTVPAARMKAGEPHTVHLSPAALALLAVQVGQDSRFVFPTPASMELPPGERRPLSNMALLAVLDRLGERSRTTVHGLCRATFSTWANETGTGRPDVIEACLAHEEGNRVRAAYNRAEFAAERRALLVAWADYLAQLPAVVLPFEARAA